MDDFDPDAYLSSSPEPAGGSFDPDKYLAGFDPDAYLADKPAPEGAPMTFGRRIASSVVPAAGSVLGGSLAGAGAAALYGAPLGPIGSVVAGAAGALAGGYAASKAQDAAKDMIPEIDDRAQLAANAEAHPAADWAGEVASFAGNPAGTLAQRAASGAVMGAFSVGQQAAQGQGIDPKRVAADAAFGVVFPGGNRATRAVHNFGERLVPGRPNMPANPAAEQAHADVDDSTEVDEHFSALAQSPPAPDGATTGNPQSAPERSDRVYPKEGATAPPENNMLTQGDMDPATSAALAEANPETPSPQESQPAAPAPAPQPVAPGPNASKPRLSLKRPPPAAEPAPEPAPSPQEAQPVVEAGFPQEGEPVAVGENEATPTPQRETMPALQGETPLNDSITPAQKVAGNYPKARTTDFGKPVRVETHAGDTRRSPPDHPMPWEVKSPYDYGYFGKTMGPDGDPIDFARPKEGSPELGDKHFIIDQKDAETGKYDEPKVFTYYKDQAAAVDAYNRGFSDNKGADRLHDITEVTRPELVKFLNKHTKNPPSGPYGEPMPKVAATKPAKERAVVQDLVSKLKAQGKDEEAAKLLALPDAQVEQAIAGKRTRKYGVGTGASAGYPVEGLTNDVGQPVTANTKAKAAARSATHEKIKDWFENSAPPSSDESNGALLDRIKSHPYPAEKGAWVPTFKPREWLLAREARKTLAQPTPGNVKKFREAERLLRGSDEDVQNYRGGNRVEADIARSKRGGDDAIANAEARQHLPGTNAEEDALIAAIDAKRKGAKFDVPHEEAESMVEPTPVKNRADLKALPRRTVNEEDSDLAKIDTNKISRDTMAAAAKRKAEAAALAGKKASANVPSEEKKAGPPKPIPIGDTDEMKRLVEMVNAASKKGKGLDALPAEREPAVARKGPEDLFDRFASDERGSVDINKIKQDIADSLKITEPDSYIAREAREPSAHYTRSLSDNLHRIAQEDKAHRVALLQELKALPKELNNPKTLEKMYLLREAGKLNALTPDERALYDQHLKPILDQNDQFVQNIRAIDPDRMGPDVLNHISRLTKGDTSAYNMLKDRDDPTGPGYNGLSVNANAAKTRKFVALERVSDGKRFVISPRDNGYTLWQNYKPQQVKAPNFEFESGKPRKVGSVDYIMRDALTPEIEANARGENGKPIRYYHNAALSAVMANAQLGSMARHLAELNRISQTPEFAKMTTRNRATAEERGWKESLLPNFRGTYMDPQLRYVFDDYAKPGFDTPDWWRNLNQSVTKLLFWTPTAHMANVGAHWFVGRGWDWITPKGMRSLAVDGTKAIRSVIDQDELQQTLRRAGAGTISGGVITRNFIEKVGKAVGEDIEKNPSKWGPIADKVGIPLNKLAGAIYDGSSRVMWAANDMFLTQRVLELQRKGHALDKAITLAERDIPNYRLPTTILTGGPGGRFLQQAMADPSVTSFGRYHYGVFNSYANIVKDAVGRKSSAGDRLDAVGKMMAMGVLAYAVYPLLDKMARLATNNEDASENRRGPLAIPSHIVRALQGKEDVMSAMRSTATMTPLTSTILETVANKDFRGKPIVEPGDVSGAGSQSHAVAAGRALVQEGEHAVRGLVSPYSTFANADKKGVNPIGAIRDQALDIKNPSAKAARYERKVPMTTAKNATTRFKQGGSGPLEGLYDRMLGR